ncbi:zinc finger Y-chromosomal protein 1-like [Choristoneura fumiferana]|uniref:zinc finger Y-chromosomal protein 1-like n=1 Tax=Choristoneura fumiferana TaxID=7141 RepID=UPI003D154BF8
MDIDSPVIFMEEVSPDQIEVEVETSETYLLDPLTDHNYILTKPKQATKSVIPHNLKIRELKALYRCKICGYSTLKKDSMDAHSLTHKEKPKPPKSIPQMRQYIPCPSCTNTVKKKDVYEKCTECSYFTKKKTSLKIHMRIHMKEKPYKCTECEQGTESLKELIRHYEARHKGSDKFRKIKV